MPAKRDLTWDEQLVQDAIDEVERHKNDLPGKRVDIKVARNVRHVFSLKIGPDELDAIADAAEAAGVSVGAFIREAALEKVSALKTKGGAADLTPAEISAHLAEMAKAVKKLETAGKRRRAAAT